MHQSQACGAGQGWPHPAGTKRAMGLSTLGRQGAAQRKEHRGESGPEGLRTGSEGNEVARVAVKAEGELA